MEYLKKLIMTHQGGRRVNKFTIRAALNFQDVICLAINYPFVIKKSYILPIQFGYFHIVLYVALFLEEINTA